MFGMFQPRRGHCWQIGCWWVSIGEDCHDALMGLGKLRMWAETGRAAVRHYVLDKSEARTEIQSIGASDEPHRPDLLCIVRKLGEILDLLCSVDAPNQ